MTKDLLIVFVKNMVYGKVKTRLADAIGNRAAFEVYQALVELTENATRTLHAEVHVYFSDDVVDAIWPNAQKFVQKGRDLGERMKQAFDEGFEQGYEKIVLIGSDLPDISSELIASGFKALDETTCVFGPAKDGGYYLIGLNHKQDFIFENKPWSQPHLWEETQAALHAKHVKFQTLGVLNDIDTIEDLLTSNFYKSNLKLQSVIP
ncbi:TIGR04282 family arsenosugar biosynthesis glycosyltransferase [Aestuariivivens sediminis]|uniref:TIGR04282 family arsenosugar biosynthesis glycosyltransferase n=1 Tax=Aestuariivivens sediminis TaxID=2913557 RepID=UPI001F57BEC8|nr:TIGR04282 family arsenosugar biosynthesis glycosyltransferase [Aestuariivivens sediminis]